MINNRQQSGRRRGRGGQRQNTGGNNNSGGRGPESGNRIDNRARGNAAQLLEKYKTLARDAQQAGDRVLTEYYLQFADHYFRVLSETRARYEENNPSRARQEFGNEEQGFEGEEGSEGQEDDDDDFAGSFRQPQRVQQPPQQQPQASRDDASRENRPREDRPRSSYQRDDRPREQSQRDASQQQSRPDNARDEQPRENKPRENRLRRDYGDEDRGNRAPSPTPQYSTARAAPPSQSPVHPSSGVQSGERPEAVSANGNAPAPRPARRPRTPPVIIDKDTDDGEARLDIGVLPPAFSIPPSAVGSADVAIDVTAEPKRRGRPRKVVVDAPVES